ncbi:UbiH/UbiF family hydroxylase [Labrenzia sp. PHM005]|uniref:UbiH/UbiF family hydroxylase n=1 Tax=Labrenzia sp. PHM005 TaxID=2590016 RepID=UPI001140164C|nr:UbiH/UbiF family hydroxylase [Labrenzia sp. PHM005]QDG77653.1 UbiH/UbiF family hydroxylase [Labrenzia sp. PHM005]
MARTKKDVLYDAVVVGGGPSGRIAALALARSGLQTALIAPLEAPADERTTALWQKSLDLLKDLGIWNEIELNAEPLKKMRMIDGTERLIRAPETVFNSAELGVEEFGYNIVNSKMNDVLAKACAIEANLTCVDDFAEEADFSGTQATITTKSGLAVTAALAVAADGRNSKMRSAAGIEVKRWSYPQTALVLNLDHTLPHHGVSTEFHTATGPFTLVPLPGRRSSLVCVETAETAERLKTMNKALLARELEDRARSVLGKFTVISEPQTFPLSGMTAQSVIAPRLALLGETAHVFPPVGAQGLNLSMRDISDLVSTVATAKQKGQDLGSLTALKPYETKRMSDIRSRTNAVDMLNRSLLTEFLPVQAARSVGMYLAGKIGPFRRLLMREGMAPGTGFQLRP